MRNSKPLVIVGIIAAMVVFDLGRFLLGGGPNIVNWHSFIHPSWVVLALVLLTVAAVVDRRLLWRALFGIYFLTFFISYLNQYFGVTDILTYNCMLFNAIFATAFYLGDKT